MWDVPGGFCESTEHPVRTAEREVFEETGLQIRVVGFLGIWLDEYPDGDHVSKRTLNIYYHAIPVQATAPIPDASEVAEVGFFSAAYFPTRWPSRRMSLLLWRPGRKPWPRAS